MLGVARVIRDGQLRVDSGSSGLLDCCRSIPEKLPFAAI